MPESTLTRIVSSRWTRIALFAVVALVVLALPLYLTAYWLQLGFLVAALAIGLSRNEIGGMGAGIVLTLVAYLLGTLFATRNLRSARSPLDAIAPPHAPNAIAWLAMIALFLAAGWIGYALPGSGDHSTQGDLLIGLLTAFGVLWLPVVSALVGVRAFVQLAREQA